MSITIRGFDPATLLALLFVMIMATATPINGLNTRKLDESTVPPGTPDSGMKCTTCCNNNNPCYQSPPPPPPPSPPPPSPPKSPKKPPSSKNCPPPPPSSYIYITGPPGNLYPVDPYFSGARRRSSTAAGLPLLFGCGLMGLLMGFW